MRKNPARLDKQLVAGPALRRRKYRTAPVDVDAYLEAGRYLDAVAFESHVLLLMQNAVLNLSDRVRILDAVCQYRHRKLRAQLIANHFASLDESLRRFVLDDLRYLDESELREWLLSISDGAIDDSSDDFFDCLGMQIQNQRRYYESSREASKAARERLFWKKTTSKPR